MTLLDLPETERPRERMLQLGADAISTSELIAILLGSGIKGLSVTQLAAQILSFFGSLEKLSQASVEELCQIKGLGKAKAIQLKAAFTLGLRASKEALPLRLKVDNPKVAYNLIRDEIENEKREHFIAIFLDTKSFLIGYEVIAIGTLSQALVHPREVFYPAIRRKAASLIIAHNHPTGDPTPSTQDLEITRQLIAAGRLMGIPVNDHIIVGKADYCSIKMKGLIPW